MRLFPIPAAATCFPVGKECIHIRSREILSKDGLARGAKGAKITALYIPPEGLVDAAVGYGVLVAIIGGGGGGGGGGGANDSGSNSSSRRNGRSS